jgi:hypothetical protein
VRKISGQCAVALISKPNLYNKKKHRVKARASIKSLGVKVRSSTNGEKITEESINPVSRIRMTKSSLFAIDMMS